jgi:hypothetical protein
MPMSLPPLESTNRVRRRPSFQDRFTLWRSVALIAALTLAILLFGQGAEATSPRSQTAPGEPNNNAASNSEVKVVRLMRGCGKGDDRLMRE